MQENRFDFLLYRIQKELTNLIEVKNMETKQRGGNGFCSIGVYSFGCPPNILLYVYLSTEKTGKNVGFSREQS